MGKQDDVAPGRASWRHGGLGLVGVVLLLAIGVLAPSSALAAPDITLVKHAPGSVLYGDESPVTLRVSNPEGQPPGYNLTLRDVLPEGVEYVAGSGLTAAGQIEPQVIPNEPETGETTLIFDNVSDLSPNSTYELSYRVSHDTTFFSIGQTYTNTAQALISDDARFEPEIEPDGTAGDENVDGSATAEATTRISAIEIIKSQPSPEGEILRGAHDHQTVYTLTVNNNSEGPTDAIRVEDWLPAGLEFLGCGTGDNTSDAGSNDVPGDPDEYDGSGPLNPGHAPAMSSCREPDTVETVLEDPDGSGPLTTAVYTHVVWEDVADLVVDGQVVLQYAAAVPLRANTMTWPGGLPPAADGSQGSNLDNNTGDETYDEQPLLNYALAIGTFAGAPASDDDTLLRHAEDLAIQKSVVPTTIVQGQVSEWTMHVETSEYRYTSDVVVTDTLPDGLCPLGDQNFENAAQQEPECGDDGSSYPSPSYSEVTEQTDGKYTIVWDDRTVPGFAAMQPSSELTIAFPTRTRSDYQENYVDGEPVLAEDSWENTVRVDGSAARICAPSDPECDSGGTKVWGMDPDPRDVTDVSAASQHAGGIDIDKKVLSYSPTFVDCDTGTYVDGPAAGYGPGDTVCWQLRIDFPDQLDTGQPTVTDFLPPGVSYVPGSAYAVPGVDTVDATFDEPGAADGVLTWELDGDVPPGDQVFEWRFETTVGQAVEDRPGEVRGNLMKVAYPNTDDTSFPMRDAADIEHSQALLGLTKGVSDINDGTPNPANTDGGEVVAGDDVTFRVDLSNTGDRDAGNIVVWDELQDGITCDDVDDLTISDGGTCTGTRITWTGLSLAAGGTDTLTYDVTIPTGVEPGRTFNNDAGVVSYTSETNTGTPFTYEPTGNIDPSVTNPNAPEADDGSHVSTPNVTISKTRETDVNELPGNNLQDQATIGELIHYTATITIPEGTTLYGTPTFTDTLGARQTFVDPPAATATLNGVPVDPGQFTLDTTGNVVSLEFPTPYTPAGSEADTIEIAFSARVADVAANHRTGSALNNTAHFAWSDEDGSAHNQQAGVNTTIVEPNVAVTKAQDDGDGVVEPGDQVHYTVTARNTAGTHVSRAHDVEVVDDVPDGMTPSDISPAGSYDSGTNEITWTIASIAPGGAVPLTYTTTVDEPATAGEVFTNTVDLTATSLAGNATGERTATSTTNAGYLANAEATVSLGEATLTKGVNPTSATIGQQVTYTAEATFPANVNYFDATLIDTLPDGLVYDGVASIACVPGPCAPPVATLTPEPQPDGTTDVAWYLGDLPSLGADRTYTITYRAHVAAEYADTTSVVADDTLLNAARAFYNGSDEIDDPTTIPDPVTFSDSSNPAAAELDVVEPAVTIDKNVSGDLDNDDVRDTQPGDDYTYSLVVRNDGTSDAYDIEVRDTPDVARLSNIQLVPNGDVTVTDSDPGDGTLGWTIPGPLEPEESVTISYTADLAPSANLTNGDTVVNTADVTEYRGVPLAERLANPTRDYRRYTDVPDDTVTLEVHLPELTVSKTTGGTGFPESAVAQVGEPFPWRVVVSNESTYADADSVDVRDVLPANWTYVPGSASFDPGGAAEPAIAPDPNGRTLTWANVADLGPGDDVVLTFQARPTAAAVTDPGSGPLSPNVNDADASAVDASGASASATGDYAAADDAEAILEIPDISVTKTPDNELVDAGDPASYTIVIANDGDVPAREVVVTDVLGAGQTYAAGTASAAPLAIDFDETAVDPGPGTGETTIEWQIAEIPANSSVTITLPIDTDPGLADESELVNDASVVSREITTPVGDQGGHEVNVDSDVSIEKQAQAGTVDAGDEMDFTLTVRNLGPSDATGVTVRDELPANLSFVSVSGDPSCAESEEDVLTCAIGALGVGDSVDITLRARVSPDETVGVSNTATVTADHDSDTSNNSATANKPVGVAANVTVDKQAPAQPVLQGTSFDYMIRVSNTGVSAAADVTLEDSLPSGVSFEAVSTDTGTCEEDPDEVVSCELGQMEPDAVAEVTVTVLAVDVGTPTNTATVGTSSNQTTTDDDDSSADVTILPAADLGVTKSAPASADAGGQIEYSLEVTNNGPSPATGVTLTDTLPVGVQFVSADPACTHLAGVVTCAVGDLAVSESRSYAITVSVPFALGGQVLTNAVVVGGNEGDLVPENDGDQATTTVGPAADVSISKTSGGATAGGTASWTLVVRNDGPSTAEPVTVTDTLPPGTTLRSATPGQGSCAAAGAAVTCDLGAIATGGSTQIGIVADVAAGTAGQQLLNRATVAAPQPDPDPSNNTGEVTTPIGEPAASGPNLTLSKRASTQRPELGESFSYRLVVTNTGDAAAEDVRVVDTMNRAVEVERVTTTKGRCSSESSEVTCSLGTLAAGERETVRLVVVPIRPGRIRNVASASTRGGPDVVADGDGDTDGDGQPDLDPSNNSDTVNVRVTAPRAAWALRKRASRGAVRGGEIVRFAIRVRVGRRAIANARVCDRLPSGLVFVRARGARFRSGQACWTIRYLPAGARRTLRVVTRAERGFVVRRVRNVAVGRARNAVRRTAGARVRVDPAFGGSGGGVTG
ncbi:MAG TPA: isopeptide-forming domain-containing fimbrial protein [Thermoleophilaceae bacterium]|nr:isopeptide-forming domain-containing fimbrial protein [Thermoleophilaceae bacterium]